MSDIFNEVTEELRAEQMQQFFKENYKTLLGLIVAVFVIAIGYSAWQNKHQESKTAATAELLQAVNSGKAEDLQRLAEKAPKNQAALAQMILAGQYLEQNKTDEALGVYQKISASSAPSFWKDLARYNQAALQSNKAQWKDSAKTLEPLLAKNNAFRPMALELKGAMEAKQGNNQKAFENYAELSTLTEASGATRDRAKLLMRYYQP